MDTRLRGGAVHNIADIEETDVELPFHAKYLKIRHQFFTTRTTDASTNDFHVFNYVLLGDASVVSIDPKSLGILL